MEYLLFGPGLQYFSIDRQTGVISVAESGVDFESVNAMMNPLIMTVIAQDRGQCWLWVGASERE